MTKTEKPATRPTRAKQPRRDPRVAGTRVALNTALMALLNDGPIERITILALTSRAGIGYATFFRHYPDIDTLLAELSHKLLEELIALMPAGTSVAANAATIIRFIDERRLILRPIFVGASASVQREVMSLAMAAASRSRHFSELTLPQSLAIAHSVTATINVLTWRLREGEQYSPGQAAAFLHKLAFEPLGLTDLN